MGERQELNGKRIRRNDGKIFIIIDGRQSWVPNERTYQNLFASWDGVEHADGLADLDEGPALQDGAYLAQDVEQDRTYLVNGATKHFIASAAAVNRYGFDKSRARPASAPELAAISDGPEIA